MNVMVDIETLGTDPGGVIVSIGAVKFDSAGLSAGFYRPVDVLSSLFAGLTVDPKTVEWWRGQNADVKGALYPGLNVRDVLGEFAIYLQGANTVWAKGPDFDLVLLRAVYQKLGMKIPWSFRHSRDVRTILALAPSTADLVKREGAQHHALADARYQADQVRAVYAALRLVL